MSIKNILENKTTTIKASFAGIATAASLILPMAVQAETTYTVKSGDTLSEIASTHGTTVDKLAKINKINNIHLIHAGQILELDAAIEDTDAAPVQESQINEAETSASAKTSQASEVTTTAPVQESQTSEVITSAPAETSQTSEVPTEANQTNEVSSAVSVETSQTTSAPVETSQTSEATTAEPTETKTGQTNEVAASAEENQTTSNTSGLSTSDAAAKEFIAQKESGGNYNAKNGQYYGRYQLSDSYLNGDLSEENQERVADAYVSSRYGSWTAAQAFWNANGWY
ncbi:TPA: LysM peptidoglycan-binding domain-containing protein [Streptococcus mutans]|uniref:aggregation-promoting factor n=1 Tax=Streptococcus mutans TaxID=1309 RepID=UPI0014554FD3|nr:LysM peptidoglycan-binding domain-containing protein [Streptococcus mutans]MCB5113182.1 LysM peptidoglycan-binding domain-containing protein [Streptococcus mutans]NLQ71250.1 LysM peptidoglycan-binding domain-containing protein [Streptococcus mutans]